MDFQIKMSNKPIVDLTENKCLYDFNPILAYGEVGDKQCYIISDESCDYKDKWYPFVITRKYLSDLLNDDVHQETVACVTGIEWEYITFDELFNHIRNTYTNNLDELKNVGILQPKRLHEITNQVILDILEYETSFQDVNDLQDVEDLFKEIRDHIGINDDNKPDSVISAYVSKLESGLRQKFNVPANELISTINVIEYVEQIIDNQDYQKLFTLDEINKLTHIFSTKQSNDNKKSFKP